MKFWGWMHVCKGSCKCPQLNFLKQVVPLNTIQKTLGHLLLAQAVGQRSMNILKILDEVSQIVLSLQPDRFTYKPTNSISHPCAFISHFRFLSSSTYFFLLAFFGCNKAMGMAAESQFHVLAVDDSLIDRKWIEKLLKTSSFQGMLIRRSNFSFFLSFFFIFIFFIFIFIFGVLIIQFYFFLVGFLDSYCFRFCE